MHYESINYRVISWSRIEDYKYLTYICDGGGEKKKRGEDTESDKPGQVEVRERREVHLVPVGGLVQYKGRETHLVH